nr:MAG TPA: hypothetical protein [Caudoviricetes sp.]
MAYRLKETVHARNRLSRFMESHDPGADIVPGERRKSWKN